MNSQERGFSVPILLRSADIGEGCVCLLAIDILRRLALSLELVEEPLYCPVLFQHGEAARNEKFAGLLRAVPAVQIAAYPYDAITADYTGSLMQLGLSVLCADLTWVGRTQARSTSPAPTKRIERPTSSTAHTKH